VTLEVHEVGGGTTTLDCPGPGAQGESWSCAWNAGGVPDSTQFTLRAKAVDRFGNATPDWTAPLTVTVDATPPTVHLTAETEEAFADSLLGSNEIGLTGRVEDDREVAQVRVCAAPVGEAEDDCAPFDVLMSATPDAADWYAPAPIYGDEDGAWRTFFFYGVDSVGNRSPVPVTRTAQVDVVAPTITVTWAADSVVQTVPRTLLSGSVSDGHSVMKLPPDTQLYIAYPDNTADRYALTMSNGTQALRPWARYLDGAETALTAGEGNWSYSDTMLELGEYQLSAQFEDEAGNRAQVGPFNVTAYASDDVASLSVEQAASGDPAIGDQPFSYTFIVQNHGPSGTEPTLTASLPEGLRLDSVPADCSGPENVLVCELGPVASGATAVRQVGAYVPLTTTGKLVSSASVTSTKVDLNDADNETELLYIPVVQPLTGLTLTTDAPHVYGEMTTLTATFDSGTDVLFDWNFGDGETTWGIGGYEIAPHYAVSHAFPAPGVYTTVVTATNSLNMLTSTTWITIISPIGGYTVARTVPPLPWLWVTLLATLGLAVGAAGTVAVWRRRRRDS
jgi:hypothetical protein